MGEFNSVIPIQNDANAKTPDKTRPTTLILRVQ